MIKNYFIVAVRNILRNKATSLINILGLGLGIGVFILIALFVTQEYKVDNFIKDKDRVFRLEAGDWALMGPGFAMVAEKICPEVEEAVSIQNYFIDDGLVKIGEEVFRADGYMPVTNSFPEFFGFKILHGNTENPLSGSYDLVLTESEAKRLFGNDNPIGKVVTVYDEYNFTVTAVLEDPKYFHLPFNALFSFDILIIFNGWDDIESRLMNNMNNPTYLKLASPELKDNVVARLTDHLENILGSKLPVELNLRPVSDIYFHGALPHEGKVNHGNPRFIGVMIIVAVLILFLASVNYINLCTAQSSSRAREIGVRKVMGGNRLSIISQFLGESILVSLLAMLVGIALVEVFSPVFSTLVERDLSTGEFINPISVLYFLVLGVIIGLMSGLYPSLYLSSFVPSKILKGDIAKGAKGRMLRKVLIIFQFSVSVTLIISTLIIFSQLNYFTNYDVGFDKDQILNMRIPRETSFSYDVFRDKVLKIPSVQGITRSNSKMGQIKWQEGFKDEFGEHHNYSYHAVDPDYIDVVGLDIIEGRNFDWDRPSDLAETVIINENLAKMVGLDNPIGEKLGGGRRLIIGVVKDFNFNSLHSNIGPLALNFRGSAYNTYNVRVDISNISEILTQLQLLWDEYALEEPFEYSFLNESFESSYRSEKRMGRMFSYFAIIAVFIGCMGLFGLSAHMLQARVKEMGIRKVMGASTLGIMTLMGREFSILVLISNVIAWPVVYFAMSTWLQSYPYKTSLSIVFFLIALLVSFAIAYITVLYHSWKTANANPVKALKYE